jgi:hypothetical protein
MATRHPGVRRWRVKPVDRPQEINATTSHTYRRHAPGGGLPLPLHQGSVGFLSGGDSPARLIAKGGVELPGGMAGGQAIVQLLASAARATSSGQGSPNERERRGRGKRSGASAYRAASSCRGAKRGWRASCHQLGPARGEPLEDITKVGIIQVGWRLQQPQHPYGIGLADLLQRHAVLLIPQPNQGGRSRA